jgi:hypothetical protein
MSIRNPGRTSFQEVVRSPMVAQRPNTSTCAVSGFQHHHFMTSIIQEPSRCEAGDSRSDHHYTLDVLPSGTLKTPMCGWGCSRREPGTAQPAGERADM